MIAIRETDSVSVSVLTSQHVRTNGQPDKHLSVVANHARNARPHSVHVSFSEQTRAPMRLAQATRITSVVDETWAEYLPDAGLQ